MSKISIEEVKRYSEGAPIPLRVGPLLTKQQLLTILTGIQSSLKELDEAKKELEKVDAKFKSLDKVVTDCEKKLNDLQSTCMTKENDIVRLEKKIDALAAMLNRELARQMDILRIANRFFDTPSEDRVKVAVEFANSLGVTLSGDNDSIDDLVELIKSRILEVGV